MKRRIRREKLSAFYRSSSRAEKVLFCVITILSLAGLIYCIYDESGLNAALCVTVIGAMLVPRFLEWLFEIRFTAGLRCTLMCFIAAGCLCGSVLEFYVLVPHWDKLLHVGTGFCVALLGFLLPDILNHRAVPHIGMGYRILSAFVFALAAAAFWELYEYAGDRLFGADMQADAIIHSLNSKILGVSRFRVDHVEGITRVAVNGRDLGIGGWLEIGLYDTMNDILSNALGALIYCGLSVIALRRPDSPLARFLHPRYVWEEEEQKTDRT